MAAEASYSCCFAARRNVLVFFKRNRSLSFSGFSAFSEPGCGAGVISIIYVPMPAPPRVTFPPHAPYHMSTSTGNTAGNQKWGVLSKCHKMHIHM